MHSSGGVTIVLITLSIVQAFLPGIFCALIIFPILRKTTKAEKMYISVLLLFCFLFVLGSHNILGMQHPDVFLFTLSLGFLGIKLVEKNIENLHASQI